MSQFLIFCIVALLVVINSTGQVMLKKAALTSENSRLYLMLGYLLFIISLIIVQYLLVNVNFSILALVLSINVVGVLFFSVIFLDEKMTSNKLWGSFIVAIGGYLFVSGDYLSFYL